VFQVANPSHLLDYLRIHSEVCHIPHVASPLWNWSPKGG